MRAVPVLLVAAILTAACSSGTAIAVPAIDRSATFAGAFIAAGEVPSVGQAFDFRSPFPGGSHGFDISYPQCPVGPLPGADFGIVGANGGKPFTANPCFAEQWRSLTGPGTIYLNAGFTVRDADHAVTVCLLRAASMGLDSTHQLPYALGCSSAEDTLGSLARAGVGAPAAWWVDVERGNSWSRTDPIANRLFLQGLIDELAPIGKPIGVYSTFGDWLRITGGWTTHGFAANWVAGATPDEACGRPGFSGAPVWMTQELGTWPDPFAVDSDLAC